MCPRDISSSLQLIYHLNKSNLLSFQSSSLNFFSPFDIMTAKGVPKNKIILDIDSSDTIAKE